MWYVDGDKSGSDSDAEWDEPAGLLVAAFHAPDSEAAGGESFATKLKDTSRGVAVFGSVPPPKRLPMSTVKKIASIVGEEMEQLRPDAILIYDIQDEKSRNGEQRPFAFSHTHPPRMYAGLLRESAKSPAMVVYRAMRAGEDEERFGAWLEECSLDQGLSNFVLVGGERKDKSVKLLNVDDASKVAKGRNGLCCGGIMLPERHRNKRDEHVRMAHKVAAGLDFFTTQVVYSADLAIWVLSDYDRLCKEKGLTPVRILLTFAPFGSEETLKFMQWLGVDIPMGTQQRVLSKEGVKACVNESMHICIENWKRILDACRRLKLSVPLGVSVEAVSKSRTEQHGANELFKLLKAQLDIYYNKADSTESLLARLLSVPNQTYVLTTHAPGTNASIVRIGDVVGQLPELVAQISTVPLQPATVQDSAKEKKTQGTPSTTSSASVD
eukprot:gb/GEZN01007203.1/.p1 GENE.gb/GEZN01007203.1/~~gb/GEZN01007203.1/.p1  ORF type:complete len:439 (-),score=85.15 gb/GEZN01007203.1/:194-1510(-)